LLSTHLAAVISFINSKLHPMQKYQPISNQRKNSFMIIYGQGSAKYNESGAGEPAI